MVGFGILNEKNRFTYNGITITMEDSEDFSVFCEGNKIATPFPEKYNTKQPI